MQQQAGRHDELRGEDALRLEARFDALKAREAGQQQAGGDEQQDPQPELGNGATLQWTERNLAD